MPRASLFLLSFAAGALTSTALPAAADIPAQPIARHLGRPSKPHPLSSDPAGRIPVTIALPSGVSARDLGLLPVAPGVGAIRMSPNELDAFVASHSGLAPQYSPPRRPLLDRSQEWTRAASFRNTTGVDGSGVVVGIVMVQLTGWLVLDPLIALVVGANIVWTGVRLLRDTAQGLLDRALPPEEMKKISGVLSQYEERDIRFHALRTRASGQRRFVSMHVLVPGRWTVQRGHDLSEKLEAELAEALRGNTTFFIHIEPFEDPASFADQSLDRERPGGHG